MGQEGKLEIIANTAGGLPCDLGGEDPVTDGEALAERGDSARVNTRSVGMCAIRGRDIDGAPGRDTGDDRFTTFLEELGKVGTRGIVLAVPEAGDGGYGLARVVERPTVDRVDSVRVRVIARDLGGELVFEIRGAQARRFGDKPRNQFLQQARGCRGIRSPHTAESGNGSE